MITQEIIGSERGGVASRFSAACSDSGCPGTAELQLGFFRSVSGRLRDGCIHVPYSVALIRGSSDSVGRVEAESEFGGPGEPK